METDTTEQTNKLSQYLPAIYQEDPLMGRFLMAFEKILLGPLDDVDGGRKGLEETIDEIATFFDPERTPTAFLDWLSGWVALSLRADLYEEHQREFIANAVRLYRLRGTKQGLAEVLRIYTRLGVTITEPSMDAFQLADYSTVGVDTLLSGGPPYFFHVFARLSTNDPASIKKKKQVITAILNMEKPAHTSYVLDIVTPSLQTAVNSTVGVDTLLGQPQR
ncbi:MAG: phage tail protein [Pyrinomonadaceae bacterium]